MLNEIVKKLMEKNNIGNKELAARSNIPLRTINNILSGLTENPTLETMRALAKALNCTLDDFVSESEQKNQSYFIDSDSAKIAQEIYENPDLRLLFDTTRKVDPEDLKLIAKMVSKMVKEENGEED